MSQPCPGAEKAPKAHPLPELAALFLKLGVIGFGGPAAHIAMMEDEVVRRRGWLTREKFLDLLGATNLIPGPNSTELAIFIGRTRAGFPGLLVAGVCFILPAVCIVMACGWAYVRFGTLPHAAAILYGIKPVLIAVIIQALWSLARTAIRTIWLAGLGAATIVLNLAGVHELLLLLIAGLTAALAQGLPRKSSAPVTAIAPLAEPAAETTNRWLRPVTAATTAAAVAVPTPFGLAGLFWFFVKVGSVLYGSGYVLLAFLRADLVERWHWISESQLLDAIAVGQVTPGPVFTTATFIGFLLGGIPGGLVATAGIFLPAFVFVALSAPWVQRLRQSRVAGALLDGVNVASLALMAVVLGQLSRVALIDGPTIALAALSVLLLIKFRINSAWLVGGGAAVGLIRWLFLT